MKIANKLLLFNIMLVFLFIGMKPVYAVSLSPSEASLVVQGTIPDIDFFILAESFGFQAGETVNYWSDFNPSGWSASLLGAYKGTNLNVTYSGDISAFPLGPITWTTSGFYGADTWNGSGSALILDTPTGFQVDFNSSLTIGGKLGFADLLLVGAIDPDEITYIEDTSSGEVVIEASPKRRFPIRPSLRIRRWWPPVIENDIKIFGWEIIKSRFDIDPPPDIRCINGPITTVPEPSTLLLLGPGLAVVIGFGRKRLFKKS